MYVTTRTAPGLSANNMLGVIRIVLGTTLLADATLLALVLKQRTSTVQLLFAVYIAGIAAWTFSILLNTWVASIAVANLVYASAAIFLTAQIWFAKFYPDRNRPVRFWEYWSLALGVFFFAASFAPGALFSSITFAHGYVVVHNGYLAQWYSSFVVLSSAMPVVIFVLKRRSATDAVVRAQLFYLAIGFCSFLVLIVLANSVLPVFFGIYVFNVAGPVSSLLLAAAVFYVIWRHQFLDIRKAVQRGVIYSCLIALIVATYETLLIVIERYFHGSLRALVALDHDIAEPATAIIVTVIGIFAAPYVERYFRKLTDRVFFKDAYEYAAALESLSEILHTSVDFDELILRIQASLAAIYRAEYVRVLVPESVRGQHDRQLLESQELFEPIHANSGDAGGILVGAKRSGDRYSAEDKTLLRTFALQASTALARAQLFRQVREHASELEKKVAERTEQLEAAQKSERHMMLDIAHGIKSPLAVFSTTLDSLLPKIASVEPLRHSLKQVSDFVTDLLELARLEHAQSPLFARCDLTGLANEICEEVEIVAAAHGITVTRDIEPHISVRADARELRTAVMNLAANSVKYMRATGTKMIDIRLSARGCNAELSVRDTGIGIAADALPHVFDRFYRANVSDVAGSGLGLAISKRIIEMHGGTLEAQSAPGQGTTMTVVLPRLAEPENAA